MAIDGPEPVTVEARDLVAQPDATVVFLDVRYSARSGSRRAEYERGHIPGAYFVELNHELSGPDTGHSGRHPLPEPAALQANIRKWRIGRQTPVVVYGDAGGAARAWFMLRWAGVETVRFLNGGLAAWVAAGGAVAQHEPTYGNSDFTIVPGSLPTLTADEAAALPGRGALVDTRNEDSYNGVLTGLDSRGGHIPGAVNLPATSDLTRDGALRSPDEIRSALAGKGIGPEDEIGLYCGGGVAASLAALALRSAGIEAPVYVGSWSDWISDPDRPIEQGAKADGQS